MRNYFLVTLSFPNIEEDLANTIKAATEDIASKNAVIKMNPEPENKGYTFHIFFGGLSFDICHCLYERRNPELVPVDKLTQLADNVCEKYAKTQACMSICDSNKKPFYLYYYNNNNGYNIISPRIQPNSLAEILCEDPYWHSEDEWKEFIKENKYLGVLADISSIVFPTRERPKSSDLKDWINHMGNHVPVFLKTEAEMPKMKNFVKDKDYNEDEVSQYLGDGLAIGYYDVDNMPIIYLCPELINAAASESNISYKLLYTQTLVHELAHALMDTWNRHKWDHEESISPVFVRMRRYYEDFQNKQSRKRILVFCNYQTLPEIAMEESMANCVALNWIHQYRTKTEFDQVLTFVRKQPTIYQFGEYQYRAGADWKEWHDYKYLPIDYNLTKWFHSHFKDGKIEGKSAANYRKVDYQDALYHDDLQFDKPYSKQVVVSANPNIRQYDIPSGVSEIGNAAFDSCHKLTKIHLPDSLRKIHNNAFCLCTKLKEINVPSGVESIGSFAFAGCSNLTKISLPKSITSIENNTFYKCPSLQLITVPVGSKSNFQSMLSDFQDKIIEV